MLTFNLKYIDYFDGPELRCYNSFLGNNSSSFDIDNPKKWHPAYDEPNPFDGLPTPTFKVSEERKLLYRRQSLKRTKSKIYYYCRSNKWDWFITFTFSSSVVDRYDYNSCSAKIRNWLHNIKRDCPNVQYILVPELHKNGAFHFHGLFKGSLPDMVYSGHNDKKGRYIYNVNSYSLGFTTATRVAHNDKVSSYLIKYITKDFMAVSSGKKRYWISSGLDKACISNGNLNNVFSSFKAFVSYMRSVASFCKVVNGQYHDTYYFSLPSDFVLSEVFFSKIPLDKLVGL